MKKILLVNASPRKDGNSDMVTQLLEKDLNGCDVMVFNMREKNCKPCMACGICQGKDTQMCVQNDDITSLLPVIDQCDAIVVTSPIYNQQITSQAKLFIERFYPFFHVEKENMSNTSKHGKKGALVCVLWGSDRDTIQRYADWTVSGFSQMGATNTRALVFDGIPERGQIKERSDYLEQLHGLVQWLAE